jgi:hypothetical protein
LRITHPDDITATAIAGVAAMIVFNTTPWMEQNVGSVVQGADTAAAWWRTQTVAGALSAFADRTFETWSHDASIHIGGGDQVNDELLAAALTANYLGDHGAWRQLYALLGQDKLVRLNRNSDPADGLSVIDSRVVLLLRVAERSQVRADPLRAWLPDVEPGADHADRGAPARPLPSPANASAACACSGSPPAAPEVPGPAVAPTGV